MSAQGFLLWITVLLVVMLSHCLCKDLCSGALFWDLIVVKLSCFLCEACAVNYCFVNGEALTLSTQGFRAVDFF